METTTTSPSNPVSVRPTFLTVICILSFIGSGLGLASAVRNYANADNVAAIAGAALENAQDKIDEQGNNSGFVQKLMNSVSENLSADKIRKSAIVSLIENLFTLTGAIMMWSLRKAGFYIYLAGIIIMVAGPLILMGNTIGLLSSAFSAFIGVVFVVMYAVNLKAMTK